MTEDIDQFLKALEIENTRKKREILDEAKNQANKIKMTYQSKIESLNRDSLDIVGSPEWINSIQNDLVKKNTQWKVKINQEKRKFLDELFNEACTQFKNNVTDKELFQYTVELFKEIKPLIDDDFFVQISKGIDIEDFKEKCKINSVVRADLEEIGVLVVLKNRNITIENTFHSRLKQTRQDLEIKVANILWEELNENPWTVNEIMTELSQKIIK